MFGRFDWPWSGTKKAEKTMLEAGVVDLNTEDGGS